MSFKKILIILISVLVLALLVVMFKGKKNKGLKVSTERVASHSIVEEVAASGKIYPETEVKISPDVSGEITELYVKEGDTVKQGQLLLKINPELYLTSLDQAKASLNNAKANAANSEAQQMRVKASFMQQEKLWTRSQKLFQDKVISQQDYDNAQAQFEMAKAEYEASQKAVMGARFNVESVEANVQNAMKSYGRTSILAPADGIVTALNSEKGERVVGTSQMAGTEIMRISNLANMEVRVDVNENDIVRIKLGDTANITVDAYENRKFKGIVTEVANSAKQTTGITTDQVTSFEVKVRILSSSYADLMKTNGGRIPFRPGMSASVNILTSREDNVLSIPVSSVTVKMPEKQKASDKSKSKLKTDDGEKKISDEEKDEIVWIVKNGVVEMRKVKTGIQDNKYIKVIEGVKEGEEVVAFPFDAIAYKLKQGDKVEIVKKESLFEVKK